jgi:hypothetical protein
MLDLVVFDDGVLVGRGSVRSAIRAMAEAGVFRSGSASIAAIAGPGPDGSAWTQGRDALLAGDPSAVFIPFDALVALRLKRGWFGNGRLELVGLDGTTRRYDWKKLYNDFDDVEALLRRAAGPKVERA